MDRRPFFRSILLIFLLEIVRLSVCDDPRESSPLENDFHEATEGRGKRDDGDEDTGTSGSSESSRDDAAYQDSSVDTDATQEMKSEDSRSKTKSDEDSSGQPDPNETGSMDLSEVREERSASISRDDPRGSVNGKYRRASLDKRYLLSLSHERDAPRTLIRIPIFPGK